MEGYFYETEEQTKTQLLVEKVKNMANCQDRNNLKALAMFVVGLTVLQPYHASISGSRFAINRFGVPNDVSSIYVSKFHTAFHLLNVFGIILVNLYMWFYGIKHLQYNPLISVFTGTFVLIFNFLLLIAYTVKRSTGGSLTLYYVVFCFCALCAGINQSMVASVGVEYLAFFVCGLQFTGIWVTFYHTVFLSLSKFFPNLDVDFWIITVQILIAGLISLVSVLLWNNCFGNHDLFNLLKGNPIKGDDKDRIQSMDPLRADGHSVNYNGHSEPLRLSSRDSPGRESGPSRVRRSYSPTLTPTNGEQLENLEKKPLLAKHTAQEEKPNLFISIRTARSPILMSAFSMAVAFFFYPSIAPYKLASLEHAHKIDLSVLIISAFPPLAICALCLLQMGPDCKWENDKHHWHYFWYLGIPYLLSPICFLIAMHYPQNGFSKFVKNPFVLGVLTDLMIVCYSILKSVGYSGAGLQEEKRNGTVSTFNMMFSFLFLITGSFWGSGYIEIYNKYERSDWPTNGMFFVKAFLYWATKSFDEGFSNFKSIFTRDLYREIMDSVRS